MFQLLWKWGLYTIKLPHVPVELGRPWLLHHNPQSDGVHGTSSGWSCHGCQVPCLYSASCSPVPFLPTEEEPVDQSTVPSFSHDLQQVFSMSRASALPPHQSYDCEINLHPGTTPTSTDPLLLASSAFRHPQLELGFSLWRSRISCFSPLLITVDSYITIKNRFSHLSTFVTLQGPYSQNILSCH